MFTPPVHFVWNSLLKNCLSPLTLIFYSFKSQHKRLWTLSNIQYNAKCHDSVFVVLVFYDIETEGTTRASCPARPQRRRCRFMKLSLKCKVSEGKTCMWIWRLAKGEKCRRRILWFSLNDCPVLYKSAEKWWCGSLGTRERRVGEEQVCQVDGYCREEWKWGVFWGSMLTVEGLVLHP